MVDVILKELEVVKAKVDEAISHVKSGVTTLNEDQVDKLHELMGEIGMAAETAEQKISHMFGSAESAAVTLVDGAEAKVEGTGTAVKVEGASLIEKVEGVFEKVKDKAEELLGIDPKPETPEPPPAS